MADALSQRFLESVRESRDRLYAAAAARGGTEREVEAALLSATRKAFAESATGERMDGTSAIETELKRGVPAAAVAGRPGELAGMVMPADVWARVSAAVQMEAAASAHGQALPAESELLKPDPMLAPKKRKVRDQEEAFDISSPKRVLAMVGAVVIVGGLITGYILWGGGNQQLPAASRPVTAGAAGSPLTEGAK